MLLRSATVRDLDRLTARVFDTATRTSGCRLDAYRDGETFFIDIDLPGEGRRPPDRPRRAAPPRA